MVTSAADELPITGKMSQESDTAPVVALRSPADARVVRVHAGERRVA
jgi:hypothetical protein